MNKDSDKAGLVILTNDPVVIENVIPQIDHGKFPVKVIEGDTFFVYADIFTNGNNSLAARILYQYDDENSWRETYLKPIGNDRWEGQFRVEKTGSCKYFIKAWIDPIATWQSEMTRRVHHFLSLTDLLPTGVSLLEGMAKKASKEDKALIKEAVRIFKDQKRADEAGQLAMSFRFTEWLNRYPDMTLSTETDEFELNSCQKKVEFSSWYTMFPRSASPFKGKHGTFQDVVNLMPRIANMGFDVLNFPPIHPIGNQKRKGKNGSKKVEQDDPGSPYATGNSFGGHETVHHELGTIDDFKDLVAEAKKHDIAIALDFALQFSPDHPWLTGHPDWFEKPSSGSSDLKASPNTSQPDFLQIKINTENREEIRNTVLQILKVWIDCGVLIFRIAEPDYHPVGWWQEIIREVNANSPEIIFYAGTVTRPKVMNYLAKSGFALSDSYFMWRNSGYELQQYINEIAYSEQKDFFRPVFRINSPDLNPYNLQSGHEPQQLIRFFLAATLSGCYGIYGPVFEQLVYEAFPGKEDYWNSEKYEIKHWDWDKETKITYLITMINRIRKENQALQQTNRIHICAVQNDQIMAYYKSHDNGNKILCVVNLNAHHRQSGMVQVPLHLINKNHDEIFIAHDLITDARYEWRGEWNYVELDPHILPFHLLRIEDYYGEYY